MKRKVTAIILTIIVMLSNTTAMAAVQDVKVDTGSNNSQVAESKLQNPEEALQTATAPEQGSGAAPETATAPETGAAPETIVTPDGGAGQGENQGQAPQEQALAKVNTTYIDENDMPQTVEATPLTADMSALTTGWYVVDSKVRISQRINITGEVNIILQDGSNLEPDNGIRVTKGNTLRIYGQEKGRFDLENGSGKATIVIYGDLGDAAIGGDTSDDPNMRDSGTVEIHGGEIGIYNRTGPGIGGANGGWQVSAGNNGTVKITGGRVNVVKSKGPAIGGGSSLNNVHGCAGEIAISGGHVIANPDEGGCSAIGIGGPINDRDLGTVKITGNAVVEANGYPGEGVPVIIDSDRANWNGIVFESCNGTAKVYGNVILKQHIYVQGSYKLDVPAGIELTIGPKGGMFIRPGAVIENKGTITVEGKITNEGAINNSGTITNSGTINNKGTINITNQGAVNNNGEIISDTGIQGTINGTPAVIRKEATVELTYGEKTLPDDKVIEGETIDVIAKIAGVQPLQKTSGSLNKVKFYQIVEPDGYKFLLGEAEVVNDTATFKLEVTGDDWKAQNSPYSILAVFTGSKELKPARKSKPLTVVQGTYYIDENDQKKFVEATPITANMTTLTTGWYVVVDPIESKLKISERINITGEVNIILKDESFLSANKGISVTEGNTLKFYGQEKGNGQIWVTMMESTGNAGIGGIVNEDSKLRNSGTVEIHGGIITSRNLRYPESRNLSGPGIGGANGNENIDAGKNGIVKITGGAVIAISVDAAAIGGGYSPNGKNGNAGNIEISGGYVSAGSANNGSAIGIGGSISEGNLGTVKISGNAVVEAEAKPKDGVPVIEESNRNNWNGIVFENRQNQYTAKVYGNVNLKQNIYIKNNYKLEVPKGTNLTVETNGGIEVFSKAAIENKGTLVVNGQITNYGAINNTGMIINKGSGTITNNGAIDNTSGEIQSDKTIQGSGNVNGNSVKPLAPPTPPTPPALWPPIAAPKPETLPENVPDGSVIENGNIVTPNGIIIKPNGEIVLPGGMVLPVENGKKPEIDKAGTVTLPDGTFITTDQKLHKTDESIWDLNGNIIRPATPVLGKVTAPKGNNKVVVYIEKECAGGERYDFVISKNPNFAEGVKYEYAQFGQKTGKGVFYRIPKGKYYVFARACAVTDKGKKIYSKWSKCEDIVVKARTPKPPKQYKVRTYKNTVKVTFKRTAAAKYYEVVLGKALKKINGEMRPVKYGKAIKKIKSQRNTITVVFKKLPRGEYYVGIRGYNYTAGGSRKVLGGWSKAKVVSVEGR